MKLYAVIMLGGALGSAARFAAAVWIDGKMGEGFPWGTLGVNIIGSFIIGLIVGLTGPNGPLMISELARIFLMVGVLGGFTTFSSFSLQTVLLLQNGQWLLATGNVLLSVLLCLMATLGGITLANILPIRS